MVRNKIKIFTLIYIIFIALSPVVALAWSSSLTNPGLPSTVAGQDVTLPGNTFQMVLTRVISMLLVFFASLALLVVIWAGFRYLTSGGNAQRAEAAKKTFLNALVGFVVVLLSYVILKVVENTIVFGTGP